MEFDAKRLENDLKYSAYELFGLYNRDKILRDYEVWGFLNDRLDEINNTRVIVGESQVSKEKIEKLMDKVTDDEVYGLLRVINDNEDTITEMAKNYKRLAKKELIYTVVLLDCMKCFSEKEFKDIILSYFATLGDVPYKIAKRYFDEKRIHISEEKGKISGFGGFADWIDCIKSGYIFTSYNKYNILNAQSVVHELGHIIDGETHIMPQHKIVYRFHDIMTEVPSTTREVGFYDFVKTNCIDAGGAEIMFANRFGHMKSWFELLTTALKIDDLVIEPDGMGYKGEDIDAFYDLRDEAIALGRKDLLEYLCVEQYDVRNSLLYSMGYWFALHLNRIRQEDPNNFEKLLSNLCMSRFDSTLEESIAMLGISYDDFVKGKYIFPKVRQEFRALKRRYNI